MRCPRTATIPRELTFAPFRAADAIATGLLTRRQLRGGQWRRLLTGIYCHTALPDNHLLWCQAAALVLGERGVLSGWSAACVWGVDIAPRDAPVEITVPHPRRIDIPDRLRVVRSTLLPGDVTRRAGMRVTTPVRTAFDLGRRQRLVEAVVGVDALLHPRLVDLDELRQLAAARPRWPGSRRLALVLRIANPAAESPMESRLRVLLIAGRLPVPVCQHEVHDRDGRFIARLDLAYPRHKLGIEYDGDHHRDRRTFTNDLRRQNALRECGWTLLRFTAADIYGNPRGIIDQVHRTLAA